MSDRCDQCGEVPNPNGQCACPAPKADPQQVGANPSPAPDIEEIAKMGIKYVEYAMKSYNANPPPKERTAEEWHHTEKYVQVQRASNPHWKCYCVSCEHVRKIQSESRLAGRVEQAREDVQLIAAEEELPGLMPESMFAMFSTLEGATEVMQSAVRATKRNITERIERRTAELEKGTA